MAELRNLVILSSYLDWDEWLMQIKSRARQRNVWGYIDPDVDNPPISTPPKEPELNISVDDNQAKLKLDFEWKRYVMADRKYEETEKNLNLIADLIQTTVAPAIYFAVRAKTVREQLVQLKKDHDPTDASRGETIRTNYERLQTAPRGTDLDKWVYEWRKQKELIQRQRPELTEANVTLDFIRAVRQLDSGWALHWSTKIRTENPSFHTVTQDLLEHVRMLYPAGQIPSAAAFSTPQAPTLGGNTPDGKPHGQSKGGKPKC
ncbi:hypothetical protein ACJ73_10335, partial [Blastomyces percursus]